MQSAHGQLDGKTTRLKELQMMNPNVRKEEIRPAEKVIHGVTLYIAQAHLRLDTVRIFPGWP